MPQVFVALLTGILFGIGLTVSQMINPEKVLSFLDFFGAWDPSLALVMLGAVGVSAVVFRLALKQPRPVLASAFQVPSRSDVDNRLIAGGVIFGLGWGLVGWCPGPAIASLALVQVESFIFVAAMIAGMLLYRLLPTP